MDPNMIEEALRAKGNADKLFVMKDFTSAKQFTIKAQAICPQLDDIAQMAATFEIFASIGTNSNHEVDLYSVFGLDLSADKSVIKKRYKKMVILLHPSTPITTISFNNQQIHI
ncbi:DnaJ domain-containing protein [Tanacetum coccineum]